MKKLVAMPFLDSVMDGTVAFASVLTLTLVEFIACLVIYRLYRNDDLTSRVRLVLTVVAVSCMVGKMCLALVAIFPLIKDRDGSEGQGDAVVGEGGGGAPSRGGGTGCCVVTDESVAGSEMTGMKDAMVECGVAPLEGTQLQSTTQAVSTLATAVASGDTKVERTS
ncbi:unnamed protein product [Ectocarpus sp. CCAP 1310/34]|nr:unnamed protein product [Ectocarpus sp. CCAP 1310/34]